METAKEKQGRFDVQHRASSGTSTCIASFQQAGEMYFVQILDLLKKSEGGKVARVEYALAF